MAARSNVGTELVRAWARRELPAGATIVDVACGSGVPLAQALVEDGFVVAGLDASPTLLAEFRRRFPSMPSACEPAQTSAFFGRRFDAALCVGLLFLLDADDQRRVLTNIAAALKPGGRLLFTAPREACTWNDALTGRPSCSLGERAYVGLLASLGLQVTGQFRDEGGNHHFAAEALNAASSARRT